MRTIKDLPEDIKLKEATNGVYMTESGLARLVGVEPRSINLLLRNIYDHKIGLSAFFLGHMGRNYVNATKFPFPLIVQILTYCYYEGKFTEEGCKIAGLPIPTKEKPVDQNLEKEILRERKPEKRLQLKLAKELKGSIEVPTEAGRIDLLTSTEIIEIKQINQWKSALGQILVYGYYYPSHQKRIYLFGVGDCHSSFLDPIKKHCKRFNVIVTIDLNHEDIR